MNIQKRKLNNINPKKGKKNNKLQIIGQNLQNEIKGLLNEFEAKEKEDHLLLNQKINPTSKNDLPIIIPKPSSNKLPKINNIVQNNKIKDNTSEEREKSNIDNKNKFNLNNIKGNLKSVKKKIKKLQKGSFMTGVGLTKIKKRTLKLENKDNKNNIENNEMINQVNEQINALLKNIDDDKYENKSKTRKYINKLKDSSDFKQMIKEIDDYKNEMHEEFDEVKYLIKFADNTHKLIDRHKNVMTNIFRGAGLKTKIEDDDIIDNNRNKSRSKSLGKYNIERLKEKDEHDNEPYYQDGYYYRKVREEDINLGEIFDKLKAINKVKDNLSNIQDDFLGYHQNLRTKIQRINGRK